MTPPKEKRFFAGAEIRSEETEDGKKILRGYAAVFNELSENLGGFREKIAIGAFTESLAGDVRALWSHDPSQVLARTKSGTLRLSEDMKGLAFEIDLPDTQLGRDAYELIRRGDVTGMSFGFSVKKNSWEKPDKEGDPYIRTLEKVSLFEISPVAWPAYPQTEVDVRSLEEIAAEGKKILESVAVVPPLKVYEARIRVAELSLRKSL